MHPQSKKAIEHISAMQDPATMEDIATALNINNSLVIFAIQALWYDRAPFYAVWDHRKGLPERMVYFPLTWQRVQCVAWITNNFPKRTKNADALLLLNTETPF